MAHEDATHAAPSSRAASSGPASGGTGWSGGSPNGTAAGRPRSLGPYELLVELGRGSNGVVFLARRGGAQLCALKVLTHRPDDEALKRFELEAAVARKLDHPVIARVLDVGCVGEHHYYAMEHCPGPTLRQQLKRDGRPRPQETAQLIATLADAMAYAHALGVIHRDLKPANVILTPNGPRITDFGLARDRSLAESLTRTGDVLGTPIYMSPEQFRGEKSVGPPCDVWGLGVILYQCLTGELPFKADTALRVGGLVQQAAPERPRRLQPDVPPELEALCLRCLEKAATSRPTAAELATELQRYAAAERRPTSGRRSSSGRRSTSGRRPTSERPPPSSEPERRPGRSDSRAVVAATAVALFLLATVALVFMTVGADSAQAPTPPPSTASSGPSEPPAAPSAASATALPDVDGILSAIRERARAGASLEDTLTRLAELEAELERATGENELLDRVRLARVGHLVRRGRFEEAIREAEPLRARRDELGLHADYQRALSLINLDSLQGIEAFGALYQRDSVHPFGQNAGALHAFFTGDPMGHELAKRCFEARPDYVPGRLSLAYSLYERGEAEAAIALIEPIAEQERDNPRFHKIVGYVHSSIDPAASLRGWERAVELTAPMGFESGIQNVAMACLQRGELVRAQAPLERRLAAVPDDAFALSYRGLVAALTRDVTSARADWERAARLDVKWLQQFLGMRLPPEVGDLLREVLGASRR